MAITGDWRNTAYPSDTQFALDSYFTKEDFSGRLAIYEDASEIKPLKIDLLVNNVDLRLSEHIQPTEHVTDSFGIICFGKAPMEALFTSTLVDTQVNYGKQYLVDAYKNKLRLTAVARSGKVPVVKFANHAIHGPFIRMEIVQDGRKSEDTVIVSLVMLVTMLQVLENENTFTNNYSGTSTNTNKYNSFEDVVSVFK